MKWLLLIPILLLPYSCGTRKKTIEYEKKQAVIERVDTTKTEITKVEKKKSENIEVDEIVIRIPRDRIKHEDDTTYQTLNDAVIDAIASATEVKIRRERQSRTNDSIETNIKEQKNVSEKSETLTETKKKNKESDTTLLANVPWYAWLIGGCIIFILIFLVMKRFRLV